MDGGLVVNEGASVQGYLYVISGNGSASAKISNVDAITPATGFGDLTFAVGHVVAPYNNTMDDSTGNMGLSAKVIFINNGGSTYVEGDGGGGLLLIASGTVATARNIMDDGSGNMNVVGTLTAATFDGITAGIVSGLGSAALYSASAFDAAGTASSDVATHAALTATHAISSAIVGETEIQALTHKTITDATNTVGASTLSGIVPTANLGSGTANNTTYLRGDQTWATVSAGGGGTVTSVATDSTLTGGPITGSGTLGINLGHTNTWTAAQTFSGGIAGAVQMSHYGAGVLLFDASGNITSNATIAVSYISGISASGSGALTLGYSAGAISGSVAASSASVPGTMSAADYSLLHGMANITTVTAGDGLTFSGGTLSITGSNITTVGTLSSGSVPVALVTGISASGSGALTLSYSAGAISGSIAASSASVPGTMSAADYSLLHGMADITTVTAGNGLTFSGGTLAFTAGVYLLLSGGTMTGPLNMGSQTLTALTAPVNPSDAATKSYVDATTQGLQVKQTATVATIAPLPTNT